MWLLLGLRALVCVDPVCVTNGSCSLHAVIFCSRTIACRTIAHIHLLCNSCPCVILAVIRSPRCYSLNLFYMQNSLSYTVFALRDTTDCLEQQKGHLKTLKRP